jgi:hypothetical protein
MVALILLILAVVLFLVSGFLYLSSPPEGRPGLAGALLAFGLAAFAAASLPDSL